MLTDAEIRKAKLPEDKKVLRLSDGGGLCLRVRASGKDWVFRYTLGGRQREMSLGRYPDLTLRQARAIAAELRAKVVRGEDPLQERQREAHSFADAARAWLDAQQDALGAQKFATYRRWLEHDVLPVFGARALDEIAAPEVFALARRIAAQGHAHKARRVRSLVSRVFRFAIQHGWCERNPAAEIEARDALPPERPQHRPAFTTPQDAARLMRAIHGYPYPIMRIALLLLAYLFVRPGELRGARWAEFDFRGALWRIPAARMKMRRDHLVPLPRQALALLDELSDYTGGGELLFPGMRSPDRPISVNTLNAALRTLGIDTRKEHCAHGFRGMAATLLAEQGWPPDIIERQLAHAEKNKVKAAYNRAEHLSERRKMMQAWADWLDAISRDESGGEEAPAA